MPEFSAVFSAPSVFSGGVPEKYFCTGWALTFDFQITNQMLYQCATTSFFVGFPPFTGVHAPAIVYAVAGTHAFAGVSYLLLPLRASMILPYSMMLPASMLLQLFLMLSALLLLASALVFNHALPVFLLSAVVGSSVAGVFSYAHAGKVFQNLQVVGMRPLAFPNAGKVLRSPEWDHLHSPMPENYGPWSQADGSPSMGQTFMVFTQGRM